DARRRRRGQRRIEGLAEISARPKLRTDRGDGLGQRRAGAVTPGGVGVDPTLRYIVVDHQRPTLSNRGTVHVGQARDGNRVDVVPRKPGRTDELQPTITAA